MPGQRLKYGTSLLNRAEGIIETQEAYEATEQARLNAARRAREEERARIAAEEEERREVQRRKDEMLAEQRKKMREDAAEKQWELSQRFEGEEEEEKERKSRKQEKAAAGGGGNKKRSKKSKADDDASGSEEEEKPKKKKTKVGFVVCLLSPRAEPALNSPFALPGQRQVEEGEGRRCSRRRNGPRRGWRGGRSRWQQAQEGQGFQIDVSSCLLFAERLKLTSVSFCREFISDESDDE